MANNGNYFVFLIGVSGYDGEKSYIVKKNGELKYLDEIGEQIMSFQSKDDGSMIIDYGGPAYRIDPNGNLI